MYEGRVFFPRAVSYIFDSLVFYTFGRDVQPNFRSAARQMGALPLTRRRRRGPSRRPCSAPTAPPSSPSPARCPPPHGPPGAVRGPRGTAAVPTEFAVSDRRRYNAGLWRHCHLPQAKPNTDRIRYISCVDRYCGFLSGMKSSTRAPTVALAPPQVVPNLTAIPAAVRREGVLRGGYVALRETAALETILLSAGQPPPRDAAPIGPI